MKLSDLIESGESSFVDDTSIADENEKLAVSSDLGAKSDGRELARQYTLSGRGKNYKKARAIARMTAKKAEEQNTTRDDTEAQIGPDFSQLNFRR